MSLRAAAKQSPVMRGLLRHSLRSALQRHMPSGCHLYVSKKFPLPFGSENFLFMERLSFCNPGCIGSASIRKLKRQGAASCPSYEPIFIGLSYGMTNTCPTEILFKLVISFADAICGTVTPNLIAMAVSVSPALTVYLRMVIPDPEPVPVS